MDTLLFDATTIYLKTPYAIFACPKSGCASPTLLSNDQARGIAISGSNLYYIRNDGILSRCSVNGCLGGSTAITNLQFDTSGLVLDGTTAYVGGDFGSPTTGLRKVDLTTGTVTPLGTAADNVLAVDGLFLYYDIQKSHYRCVKAKCATTTQYFNTFDFFAPANGLIYFRDVEGISACNPSFCTPNVVVGTGGYPIGVDDSYIYFLADKTLSRASL